jgi:hypothetical protein
MAALDAPQAAETVFTYVLLAVIGGIGAILSVKAYGRQGTR